MASPEDTPAPGDAQNPPDQREQAGAPGPDPAEQQELSNFRERIDQIDHNIVRLIMERAGYARRIGEAKKKRGTPVYRPDREKAVYENLREFIQAEWGDAPPMPFQILKHVYREIMSGSIAIEGGPVVYYMGPAASFSHDAALFRFGNAVDARPVDTIPEVFRKVESGSGPCFGVAPVDNTTEGAIGQTLDMFLRSELKVYAEHYIRVVMNLMHAEELPLSEIRKLYTVKVAREQCREWLASNLPANVEVVETTSTAAAARLAAERRDGAAVGSELAAETYGLKVLARAIQENSYNITRFFVLGTEQAPPTGDDKTSIVCSIYDRPGGLNRMLRPFEEAGINLTRIESRASRRAFGDYNFFVDFTGHAADPQVAAILDEVRRQTSFLKLLGSYPRIDLP